MMSTFPAILACLLIRPCGDGPLTVERIAEAWGRREAALRSGVIEWEEDEVRAPPMLPGRQAARPETPGPPPGLLSAKSRFAWSASGVAYERDGPIYHGDKGVYVPTIYANSVHKGEHRDLNTPKDGSAARGTRYRSRRLLSADDIHLMPVSAWARGKSDGLGPFALKEYRLRGDAEVVGGRACKVLERSSGERTVLIYVDPARDFVVVRYEVVVEGATKVRYDVEYDPASPHHAPSGWTIEVMSGKKLTQRTKGRVTSSRINAPVDDSLLEISFPGGTRLHDEATGTNSIVGPGIGERGEKPQSGR
jgi:hypothetical protein